MDPEDHRNLVNLALDTFAQKLKIYTCYDGDIPLVLKRYGKDNDGGYVVSTKALETSDVLLGYGIANDISFEEHYSKEYNKLAIGFDNSSTLDLTNPLCILIQENIVSEKHTQYAAKASSFSSHLSRFNLKDKKVFLKMDIEGAEYDVFDDIYDYAATNVTGIVLEVHFYNVNQLLKAINLMTNLERNFVLIHVHGNNCVTTFFNSKYIKGDATTVLELSFVNKNLVTNYNVAQNQTHPLPIDLPNDPHKKDVEFTVIV